MTVTPPPLPSGKRWRDEDNDLFDATVLAAAESLGVQPLAVEKDYWVCQALRAIANAYPTNIVFKGGTSLEKMRIIQRFSEDLDLLVTGDHGNDRATKRTLKAMIAAAATGTGGTPTDAISGGEAGAFHRRAYLTPPLKNEPAAGLADAKAILVELGQSGGPNPSTPYTVESLLARALDRPDTNVTISDWDDLTPFTVTILHPGRTLIEKLLRVNNFASRPAAQEDIHGWPRIGRQFYDIWALLGDDHVQALLAEKETVANILDSITDVSQAFTHPDEPIPDQGFAASPAFDPNGTLAPRLQQEHDSAMRNLYYGDPALGPSFDDVLTRIHENASRLRL